MQEATLHLSSWSHYSKPHKNTMFLSDLPWSGCLIWFQQPAKYSGNIPLRWGWCIREWLWRIDFQLHSPSPCSSGCFSGILVPSLSLHYPLLVLACLGIRNAASWQGRRKIVPEMPRFPAPQTSPSTLKSYQASVTSVHLFFCKVVPLEMHRVKIGGEDKILCSQDDLRNDLFIFTYSGRDIEGLGT